jgi:hypothetical protein
MMLPGYWVEDAKAQPGQAFTLTVTGALPFSRTVVAGADGAASYAEDAAPATAPAAALELDWLDLVARTNGRAGADETAVRVSGDEAMARAMLAALPMSP